MAINTSLERGGHAWSDGRTTLWWLAREIRDTSITPGTLRITAHGVGLPSVAVMAGA